VFIPVGQRPTWLLRIALTSESERANIYRNGIMHISREKSMPPYTRISKKENVYLIPVKAFPCLIATA
jgi:hypothetical protein